MRNALLGIRNECSLLTPKPLRVYVVPKIAYEFLPLAKGGYIMKKWTQKKDVY